MKNGFSFLAGTAMAVAVLIAGQGCSKDQTHGSNTTDSTVTSTSTSTAIAVAVDSAGTDSVYIIQNCGRGNYRDSIAASALPPVTSAYLDSNYNGYTLIEAFKITDKSGTVEGYVAVIRYQGIPVGVLFKADGSFEQVLEQREPGDMNGHGGYHSGGRYGNRDGRQRDSVALADLPSAITSYFSSNYPGDTLVKAYRNIDSSYLLISKDSVLYATLFSSGGSFISRTKIHTRVHTTISGVAASALPSALTTYLTNTYPNYVFDKAFSYALNGTLSGYIVFIDANNSKYEVEFDSSGNYIGAITLF